MKEILKQVVGIDVAQKELVICISELYDDFSTEVIAAKSFTNNGKGFEALVAWAGKACASHLPVFVMEATGVYHQKLAYYLREQGQKVSIVLPNKVSNYMRTLDIKTVTDKTAAEAIAQFGLERKLPLWEKPKEIFQQLKQLTRERDQLIVERTQAKNQLHAEQAEALPNVRSIERINDRIALMELQEDQIMVEVKSLIAAARELKTAIALLCTIPGIGLITAATVLAETNGFELITNRRQLASYAGFDIKEKQSGTSVRGKARISKRGNRYLRKAMHMPAMSAIKNDERFKAVFQRLVSKHGVKMKAGVAIQRKLLEMTFTIFKTRKPYDKCYFQNQQKVTVVPGA